VCRDRMIPVVARLIMRRLWNNHKLSLVCAAVFASGVQRIRVDAIAEETVRNLWRVHVDPATLTWTSAQRLTAGAGADVAAALSRDN
jgi:hypothetical protein